MKSVKAVLRLEYVVKFVTPMILGLSLIFFQNCGQSGSIHAKDGTVYDEDGVAAAPAYSSKSISSTDAPPLKIVFLMDNSNSMTLNNLNLQESLTSMFDNQANSLSQFNADIYIYTTAQLASLAKNFSQQTKSPSDLNSYSLMEIEQDLRGPNSFTGLIAGDLLGFTRQSTQTPQRDLVEYIAQPVVAFRETNGVRTIYPSIRYAKGSSIENLKLNVKERLEIISPERASQITDASAFNALDTESAMCGLARILKNPGQTVLPGDITSFVIVSDENEADLSGANCLYSEQREYLYKASCMQRVPASSTSDTQITYETKAGVDQHRTVLTITAKDRTLNRVITKATVVRAARNATCTATQEREFNIAYQVLNKSYKIQYSKKPLVGTREGGVPIYGAEQTGLVTPDQAGLVPTDCSTNVNRLKTILSDNTSILTIKGCVQNADSIQNLNGVATYASYPTVNLSTSTACPSSLMTALTNNGTRSIGTCTMSVKKENISGTVLASAGFGTSGTENDCRAAAAAVCAANNTLRNCAFTSHSPAVTALPAKTVETTQNSALNCNSSCALFPGLCAAGITTSVNSYAASIGATCSVTTASSSETYVQQYNSTDITITTAAPVTCSSTCNDAPAACANNRNTQAISDYNKTCSVKSATVIAGAAPQPRSLTKVEDASSAITCDTVCSASKGMCSGALTIAQHISQNLNGQNCQVVRSARTIAETVNRQQVTRLKESQLATDYCPTGFEKEGQPQLTSDYVDSSEKVSGSQTLTEYVLNQLQTTIGNKAATLSAFITPSGASNAGLSTSYGQAYESLVKSWGSGSVHDIRSPSYAPALTQLSATLKSQLIRSIVFPEVTGKKKVRQVWHRSRTSNDWELLLPSLWSATGGTVTIDAQVELDLADEIKIEFY